MVDPFYHCLNQLIQSLLMHLAHGAVVRCLRVVSNTRCNGQALGRLAINEMVLVVISVAIWGRKWTESILLVR